jgi:hypothetical protein
MKYKHQDAALSRWPSRDPIEERGGINLYAFVGNDPIGRWDRLGHAVIGLQVMSHIELEADTKSKIVVQKKGMEKELKKTISSLTKPTGVHYTSTLLAIHNGNRFPEGVSSSSLTQTQADDLLIKNTMLIACTPAICKNYTIIYDPPVFTVKGKKCELEIAILHAKMITKRENYGNQ